MRRFAGLSILFVFFTRLSTASMVNQYTTTSLTSDLSGVAANQDPNLVNPWGLVAGPTTPFWTANNGTGTSSLYGGSGKPLPLVVTVPPSGTGNPTGIVFNGTTNFNGTHFIFDSEDGSLSAWGAGTSATAQATGASGSVYKGLAINAAGSTLYAANFGLGRIDVYDSSFGHTTTSGNFADPNALPGYSPFNIQDIGGKLYVAYAATSGGTDEVEGAGLGYINVFTENGTFVQRLTTNGKLNAPWAMVLASSNFGAFSNSLLVGNFGDGTVNSYDPSTGALLGTLNGPDGKPLSITGLWGMSFGNGAQGTGRDTLYFNAGIAGPDNVEDHGLFGSITATPEPASAMTMLLGLGALVQTVRRARKSAVN
jgi:uncharacterized protein (TIGR03118 family)